MYLLAFTVLRTIPDLWLKTISFSLAYGSVGLQFGWAVLLPASTGLTHISVVHCWVPWEAGRFSAASFTSVVIGWLSPRAPRFSSTWPLVPRQPALGLFTSCYQGHKFGKTARPRAQGIFKPRCAPCVLMSLWSKQVTGQPQDEKQTSPLGEGICPGTL